MRGNIDKEKSVNMQIINVKAIAKQSHAKLSKQTINKLAETRETREGFIE